MSGEVYFIQAGPGGPIKIGNTRSFSSFKKRLVDFQTANPEPLKLLACVTIRDGKASKAERRAHRAFARSRIRGEWFAPTRELLETIEMLNFGEELDPAIEECAPRWTST